MVSRTFNTVGGKVIWDWGKLIPELTNSSKLSENTVKPIKIDNEYVEFCKIKLNIRSLISENATFEDIRIGWEEFERVMDVASIANSLLFTSYSRAAISNISMERLWRVEPNIIIFLKLCYWYSLLLQIPSINSKRKEIRSRLGGRLLRRLKKEISDSFLFANEISESTIKTKLDAETRLMEQAIGIDKQKLLVEYYNFCEVCLSEIMFAVLSHNLGYEIQFIPQNKESGYDFDVKISDRPIQIKNVFSYEIFNTSDAERMKTSEYLDKMNKIDFLYYNEPATLKQFCRIDTYKDFVISNLSIFKKAYDQKAEIVIVDMTRTWQGYLLNRFFCDDQEYIKWDKTIEHALNGKCPDDLTIILTARATDIFYRVSSVFVTLPIRCFSEEQYDGIKVVL